MTSQDSLLIPRVKNASATILCVAMLVGLAAGRRLPNPTFELKISTGTGDPDVILKDIWATQAQSVVVRGIVRDNRGGVSRCEISINDDVPTVQIAGSDHKSVVVNVAFRLTAPRTQLTLRVAYEDEKGKSIGTVKRSYWITSQLQSRQQWALVIGISHYVFSNNLQYAREDAEAVASQLERQGTTVFRLLDEAATIPNVNSILLEISRRVGRDDRVLVYFSGAGFSQPSSGEPYLTTFDADPQSESRGISLTGLFWQFRALHFPTLTVVFDTCFAFVPNPRAKSTKVSVVQASPVEQSSAAWLSPLAHDPNVDILLSSRFNEASFVDLERGHGVLTGALLDTIKRHSSSVSCLTLSDMEKELSASVQSRTDLQHPLLFSTAGESGFCFNRPAIMPERDSTMYVRTAPLFSGFDEHAPSIKLEFPRVGTAQMYIGKALRVMFVVSSPNETVPAAYQISNNGEIVTREGWVRNHSSDMRQVVKWVPMAEGRNKISIQIDDSENRYSEVSFVVVRPEATPELALLVGIDKYADSAIADLHFAQSDVTLMSEVLLNFTDIQPNEIFTLTGEGATRENIKRMLEVDLPNVSDNGSGSRGAETTVIFYFAGYGTTIAPEIGTGVPVRCLVPYDARMDDLRHGCISTKELSGWLQTLGWKNQIVILDTSYDSSREGDSILSAGASRLHSRTFGSFRSNDIDWRFNSDIQQNRVALVAGGTNEDALESDELKHGLLTSSITDALTAADGIDKRASGYGLGGYGTRGYGGNPAVSFGDIYPSIAEMTRKRSDGLQNPVLKGALSSPFPLRRRGPEELIAGAAPEVEMAASDTMEMRRVDESSLGDATTLLIKALALESDSASLRVLDTPTQINRILTLKGLGVLETRRAVGYRALVRQHNPNAEQREQEAGTLLAEARTRSESLLEAHLSPQDEKIAKAVLQSTLLAQAQLDLQTGHLDSAEANARKALAIRRTSQFASFIAAEVLAARGKYSESAALYTEILRRKGGAFEVGETPLSQEQLAMTLLWKVISSYLNGQRFHAGRLALYAWHNTKAGKVLYGSLAALARIPGLKPSVGEIIAEGAVQTDATWPREVANFLLRVRTEAELRGFAEAERQSDPRMPVPFECSVEFYVGLRDLLNRHPDRAKVHFENAVKTAQTEQLEYWVAKGEISSDRK